MAVSRAVLARAITLKFQFDTRSDLWEDMIKQVTTAAPPGLPPLDQYWKTHDDLLAETARNDRGARQARWIGSLSGAHERDILYKLNKKNMLPADPDLKNLGVALGAAQARTLGLEAGMASLLRSRLSSEADFLDRVKAQMRKGNHRKALSMLEDHKPGAIKKFFMGKRNTELYLMDLHNLGQQVQRHSVARAESVQTQNTLNYVEDQTAKALKKMLKKDDGNLFIVPPHPDVVALAATNPAIALMQKFAGKSPWAFELADEIRASRNISLADLRSGMATLEANFASKKHASKTLIPAAEEKLRACENFIDSCRKAQALETTIATGYGTRENLSSKLDAAIAAHATMTDAEMQVFIDAAEDRKASKWISRPNRRDMERDAAILRGVSTFTNPANLHLSAWPCFTKAARTGEQMKTGAKRARQVVKSGYARLMSLFP